MEYNAKFPEKIARQLSLPENNVRNLLSLLQEGCTVPFIARYRKERTSGMDEVVIAQVAALADKLSEIENRKETIFKTIAEAGKLTNELRLKIESCWDSTELEDIYLPFKPKRRTRAQVARENGLQPLADIILKQREPNPLKAAASYLSGNVATAEDAIGGASDIIAETVSEDSHARNNVRTFFKRSGVISSKVVKSKKDEEGAAKYSNYFDFSEPLRRCSAHRYLAMKRGEEEGYLRVSISPEDDEMVMERLSRSFVRGRGECSQIVEEAVRDGYKRLLKPSIESESNNETKEKADEEAIAVFGENLRQLLLSAPLGQKRVMGIDPGFRTGCKVVCLDAQGNLLHHTAIFPHPPRNDAEKAGETVRNLVRRFAVEAIAIGNGTAGRETERFVKSLGLPKEVMVFSVSEDGASIYSASEVARNEFPDQDVTVRGAVSIGRRLMDPLAELVKIDPKSIGVGQYQHDVDQTRLRQRLQQVVESCVNSVGVDLNTASPELLSYVSGLGKSLAQNIVDYRKENGPFKNRKQLLKVKRLGPTAFQQCAGFLRIPGGDDPLDNSAVHPESYGIVRAMARDAGCDVNRLISDSAKREKIDLRRYITKEVGMPTLTDIMKELEKPGRDPREQLEEFSFDDTVDSIESLREGMVLPGIVTNITNFGAFVDIGVHQDGLVHISQLSDRFVSDPMQVVHLHQHVTVRVLEVDLRRRRISLSMKLL